jgi:hypothetical protein
MRMSSTLMMLTMKIKELWMTIGWKEETKDIQQSRKNSIASFMNKEEQ